MLAEQLCPQRSWLWADGTQILSDSIGPGDGEKTASRRMGGYGRLWWGRLVTAGLRASDGMRCKGRGSVGAHPFLVLHSH